MSLCPWMRALLFVRHFFTSENGFPIHYNWPERRVGHLLGSNPSAVSGAKTRAEGEAFSSASSALVFPHWDGHESATSQGSGDSGPSALPLTIFPSVLAQQSRSFAGTMDPPSTAGMSRFTLGCRNQKSASQAMDTSR